eukprot:9485093-Pyramimonas_sp.AAC.1
MSSRAPHSFRGTARPADARRIGLVGCGADAGRPHLDTTYRRRRISTATNLLRVLGVLVATTASSLWGVGTRISSIRCWQPCRNSWMRSPSSQHPSRSRPPQMRSMLMVAR